MSQEASGILPSELINIGKESFLVKAADLFDLRSAFAPILNVAAMPEGDDDDDDDADKGGSDGGDNNDDAGSSGADADKDDVKDPDKKKLSQEAAKHRNAAKAEKARADAAEARLKEIEDKDKSEVERLTGEVDTLKAENESLKASLNETKIENEFVLKYANKFADPEVARLFLEKKFGKEDGITVDDDGEVVGMKEAVEALLKEKPKWAKGADDDDDGSSQQNTQPSGRQTNGKTKKDGLNSEALAKKFPALRGRG